MLSKEIQKVSGTSHDTAQEKKYEPLAQRRRAGDPATSGSFQANQRIRVQFSAPSGTYPKARRVAEGPGATSPIPGILEFAAICGRTFKNRTDKA